MQRLRSKRPLQIGAITLALFILSQIPLRVNLVAASEMRPPLRASGGSPDAVNVTQDSAGLDVQGFRLVSADEGWLLTNQQLYWTASGGQPWKVITPSNIGQSVIRAVFFLDAKRGWLVLTAPASESGTVTFTIARTVDGGNTWALRSLSLFEPGDANALAASVYLHWINPRIGWLVIRRATGSNFSMGTLFKTVDGGDSWTRQSIPIGEPVYFVTPEIGWTAGGAAGNQLYRTQNGGRTWFQQVVGRPSDIHLQPLYQLPKFENVRDGVLPVVISAGSDTRLELYLTHDRGESWNLASRLPMGREIAPGTRLPLAILDTQRSIMVVPHSRQVVRTSPNVGSTIIISQDPLTDGITELDMVTSGIGWAKYVEGNCERGDKTRCTQVTRLLRTTDGGQTWQTLPLPIPQSPVSIGKGEQRGLGVLAATGPFTYTQTVVGQGFDACGVPSTSQFQTWWLSSPYMAYNLYIGGSALAACSPLTASFISELASQGWKFFPTWVGPQAPCYAPGYNVSRMSLDPTTAYNQGVTEANSALDAAYNLGLTDASKTGTVIYYDLEAYSPASQACRDAVKSFISGWSGQLKSRGNVTGAYGASCGSYVIDWATITNVPDELWIAWWSYSTYNKNATVWGAPCLSDTLWINHQRLRQYAGGHNETWGGVTLNIDSDVLDGVVASLSDVTKPPPHYYFPFVGK